MAVKKNVGLVISRYYFSDKIVDAFSYYFDWNITIIDFQIDDKSRKKRFKEKLKEFKYIDICNIKEGLTFFYKNEFDFIITLHEGIPILNFAKKVSLIKKLYVFQSANLNGGAKKALKKDNYKLFKGIKSITIPKLKFYIGKIIKKKIISVWELNSVRTKNRYYDLYLCWNPADARYVKDDRLRLVKNPYHKFLREKFIPKVFQKKIMIAYQGELGDRNLDQVKRYDIFVQEIINHFDSEYEIFLKVHPRCEAGKIPFYGNFEIRSGEISYEDIESCCIFIGEDTYLGIEFYYGGSLVCCHGKIDNNTSNIDFNDGWYTASEDLIRRIKKLPIEWKKLQEKKERTFEEKEIPAKQINRIIQIDN